MSRTTLALLLAVAWLFTMWSFVTSAQVIDADACEQACQERQSACVRECAEHPNPVECDSECRDDLQDCLRECR